ncbi:MAG: hypothetical protein IID45_11830, partial [Planctomycetes bacterium]|nr:hypothetical protein [Planctomycetota bacterium]
EDGLNLTVGVVTPDQVDKVRIDSAKFGVDETQRLDVSDGCLMIDLDRYVTDASGVEPFGRATRWHEFLSKTADKLSRGLLA